jgi:hypothetical protein
MLMTILELTQNRIYACFGTASIAEPLMLAGLSACLLSPAGYDGLCGVILATFGGEDDPAKALADRTLVAGQIRDATATAPQPPESDMIGLIFGDFCYWLISQAAKIAGHVLMSLQRITLTVLVLLGPLFLSMLPFSLFQGWGWGWIRSLCIVAFWGRLYSLLTAIMSQNPIIGAGDITTCVLLLLLICSIPSLSAHIIGGFSGSGINAPTLKIIAKTISHKCAQIHHALNRPLRKPDDLILAPRQRDE